MSKQSGLGDNLYVSGYNLSGDIGSLDTISSPLATLDVTGIDKSAFERIGGLRDGALKFSSFFNKAVGRAHLRFSALPVTDQILTYCRGTGFGKAAACLVAKQLNYDAKRGSDGALTFDIEAAANSYGLEWTRQVTDGIRTDTTGTNGTGVDMLAAGSFGLQAYIQVFSLTGTSVTAKLQQSSDNGVGDAWADVVGGAFTAATGPTAQRIETARGQAVEQYLRVVTTGTFTNAVFMVSAVINEVSVVF